MNDQPYELNQHGYLDDPNFREPHFVVEFAKAAAEAPVADLPVATRIAEEEFSGLEGKIAVDVYEKEDEVVIVAPLAGVDDAADLDIDINDDVVTIKGTRRRGLGIADEDYLYQECYWGRFSRAIVLSHEVDAKGAVASFSRNGILTVRLPKRSSAEVKKVDVHFS